jgi:hypothetical protein
MDFGGAAVPILPLIDLLILMSTASLLVGFVLKAVDIATRYRPTLLGFSSIDFVLITGICLALALVLAARTWVKLNEPKLLGIRSQHSLLRRPALVPEEGGAYEAEPAQTPPASAEAGRMRADAG